MKDDGRHLAEGPALQLWPLIMLAAGRGTRMGRSKGLVSVGDEPLVAYQYRQFHEAGGGAVVVVVGPDADAYRKAAPHLSYALNTEPELGPFHSLQVGWRVLRARGDALPGCFILPVDVPAPRADVWRQLVLAHDRGAQVMVPRHGLRRGHPVALSASFADEMAAYPSRVPGARLDQRIRALAEIRPDAVAEVEVSDPQVLLNLNDQAALAQWLAPVTPRQALRKLSEV